MTARHGRFGVIQRARPSAWSAHASDQATDLAHEASLAGSWVQLDLDHDGSLFPRKHQLRPDAYRCRGIVPDALEQVQLDAGRRVADATLDEPLRFAFQCRHVVAGALGPP